VAVRWPSGKTDTLDHVAGNQIVTIREGQGLVRTAPLGR
jgi:hypothetical protein